jgi:AcrR family transcriptional regulator
MEDKLSTKEAIIKGAYEISRRKRFSRITVREIARQAGVNIAAVNYYFGSKEKLADMVIEKYKQDALDLLKIFDEIGSTPRERFKKYMQELMELSSFNILKIIQTQAIQGENTVPWIAKLFSDSVDGLKKNIKKFTGIRDDQELTLKTAQIFSCITYPMLVCHYTPIVLDIDFSLRAAREKYIEIMLDSILQVN